MYLLPGFVTLVALATSVSCQVTPEVTQLKQRLDKLEQMTLDPIKLSDDFVIAFRAQAGIGKSVMDAFRKTGYHDDTAVARSEMPCGCFDVHGWCDRHYRSRVLDNWSTYGVHQVKLSLYQRGREMAWVIFNAAGTTYDNWLDRARVVSSSWFDVRYSPSNYFSVTGDTLRARHFFMNSHSKGCPDVVGWLAIKDRPDPCPWGQKSAYPAFIFSSTASKINYNIPGTNWHALTHAEFHVASL
ncbi:hypothetical protein BaRGS_00032403 [Batillaria attramentaria]|uniref:Uncharacterized protein n=1 Tax=Batillaria attramentaria TaxID=370345 RepID=A0ABD0JMV1_9CAEN